VALDHSRYHGVAFEPDFQLLIRVSVVVLIPILAMFGYDMIVRIGVALRIFVPKQQYHLTRTIVLVPIGQLVASLPDHTPLAIVLRIGHFGDIVVADDID
jgi:hypothetical protein